MEISLRNNLIDVDNLVYLLSFAQNLDEIERLYSDFGIKLNKQVSKAIKEIMKSNKVNKEKLDFYFKKYTVGETSFAFDYCFYRAYYFNNVSSVDDYLNYIKDTDEEEHLKYTIRRILLLKYEGELLDSVLNKCLGDKDEFLKELINFNIPSELKWNLCSVVIDFKRFLNEYIELIDSCNKTFKTTLDKLREISLSWYEDLNLKIQAEGLKFIEDEFIGTDFNKYSKVYVYPRIIDAGALDYRYMDDTMYLFLGVDIAETIKIFGKGNQSSWAMTVLRILSEPNRFKILEMLSKKEMFSGEIAASLNLSNATITHHTMGLGFANLIEDESRGSKTYYRTSKNSINNLCDILEKEFNL